ncbi:hypothetical protein GCM10022626_28620 [[Pseudomonas] carboxydohydrogena]
MQLDQRFGDREAEAGAVIALGQLAFDLLEGAAEAGEGFLRNADAGVGDRHHHSVADHAATHHDASAIGRELHRIRQEIDEDLFHRPAVGDDRNGAVDPAVERQMLAVGPARGDARGFRHGFGEVELLGGELHAPGLDLRHIEDIVDDVEKVIRARQDVLAVLLIASGAERAEHAAAHHFGKADDGVERRAQFVAHVGEEFRLGLVGFLGAALLFGIFLREVGQLPGLLFECHLRSLEIDDIGGQPQVVVYQPLLVALDLGDVGADRHEAAVLGAALADVQPASVIELRLEGPRTRRGNLGVGDAGANFRHVPDLDHRLVGRARGDGRIRQLVQPLEVRVAEHQPVFRIPQDECFRDRLDGVPQAQIRLDRASREALLFGDVERDADQMAAAVAAGFGQFATHAKPDPVAVGVAHPEGLVDMADLSRQQLVGNRHQVDVFGVD